MNSAEIDYALRNDICTGDTFGGVFPSDILKDILKHRSLPICYVINTDPASKPGTHWVAFYFPQSLNEHVEVFDSFGQVIPAVFKQFAKKYGHPNSIESVTQQLQSDWSTACGQYCIYYLTLRNRGRSLNEIVRGFTPDDRNWNDAMVTAFVNKHFNMDLEAIDYPFIMQTCLKLQ